MLAVLEFVILLDVESLLAVVNIASQPQHTLLIYP